MSESTRTATGKSTAKRGFFGRIALFIRQVIDELREVAWPIMNKLWTYFTAVTVFIIAVMASIGVLGFAFNRVVV